MYYESHRDGVSLSGSSHFGSYNSTSGSVVYDDRTYTKAGTSVSAVYSYRSKRPHDAVSMPVYGEMLIKQHSGLSDYLASYKHAVESLNDEASSLSSPSGSSGRGAYDNGHIFWSLQAPQTKVSVDWVKPRSYRVDSDHVIYWRDSGTTEVALDGYYAGIALANPASAAITDESIVNAVQRLACATIPDRITGSLGQDIIDLAELPKLMTSLVKMAHEMPLLLQKWQRLSKHVRDAIDYSFRHPHRVPKKVARAAGSGYLEWLFVLSPYVEDLKTITAFLSRGAKRLLTRETFTKVAELPPSTKWDSTNFHYVTCGTVPFDVCSTRTNDRSLHVAVGWMAKGALPADADFASKARSLNRSLGVWYPSLLWDLAPWSWLIDWCLHLGDTIDNVYAIQRSGYNPIYAWATVRAISHVAYNFRPWPGYTLSDIPSGQLSAKCTMRYPFKVNGQLLPSFDGLSSTQKAILGALGLSHLH